MQAIRERMFYTNTCSPVKWLLETRPTGLGGS